MPSFCRHNRLVQNCTICSREQAVEARPMLSSSAPRSTLPREPAVRARREPLLGLVRGRGRRALGPGAGCACSRLARGADDGFRTRGSRLG